MFSSAFNPCDLGIPFINKRITSTSTANSDLSYHLSPSQASNDADDVSMDSTYTAGTEFADALASVRDKQVISKALDSMARVQCLNGTEISQIPEENSFEYDGPVISEQNVAFNPQIPGPVPPYLNIHYICESGSRLLFSSIHWAKNIAAFQYLTYVRAEKHSHCLYSLLFLFSLVLKRRSTCCVAAGRSCSHSVWRNVRNRCPSPRSCPP